MSQIGDSASKLGHADSSRNRHAQNGVKRLFSVNSSEQGKKFISHLLGLESEQIRGSKSSSGLASGIKFSDFFQGIKITPNFMFFLLFFGFFCWLFVIYWVRHNEPLANQVLGSPRAHSHKIAADRKLVAGVKNAFPVQTSSKTGEIYVPGVEPVPSTPGAGQLHEHVQIMNQIDQSAHSPVSTNQYRVDQAINPYTADFGNPVAGGASAAYGPHGPVQGHAVHPYQSGTPAYPPSHMSSHMSSTNYMVGVQGSSGPRLKTIVSR